MLNIPHLISIAGNITIVCWLFQENLIIKKIKKYKKV